MKLRNKKTGEIGYLQNDTLVKKLRVVNANNDTVGEYNSLAELNAEWEDAPEEPRGFKSIGTIGPSIHIEMGSEEEAEKAVEKLKVWKRLKDKGFSFSGWNWKTQCIDYNLDYCDITDKQIEEAEKDLDLLFGGEE